MDLRDTHDFFDKLDRERLRLTDRNTLQIRQANGRFESKNQKAFVQFGRFPMIDAGNVHCDGAALGFRPTSEWTLSGFGGLNPKFPDQQHLTYNSNALEFGGVAQYQRSRGGWDRNLFGSVALVEQQLDGRAGRRFLYTNSSAQWSPQSRLIHFMYVDFVPRTYVQTAYFDWNQMLSPKWSTQLRGLAVDVIDYARRMDLREKLEPSPFREGSFAVRKAFSPRLTALADVSYGKRLADQLDRKEFKVKLQMPQLISAKWDASIGGVLRENFISRDTYLRGGIGYFSMRWEMSLDLDTGVEKYESGLIRHPLYLSLSYSYFLARDLFLALAVERAQDEVVAINSGFFKLTYRFGNQEPAPLRDGAAPRGRL